MKMSNLPNDLIEEILSRVASKSLKRLRSTCKQWNSLFTDNKFAKKHFDNSPKQVESILSDAIKLYSMNLTLHEIHKKLYVDPCTKISCDLRLINSHTYAQVYIFKVFHCNGLLLCTTLTNKLVVWNPCTGQIRWIELSNPQHELTCFVLGYENNKSFHRYKILRYNNFCYEFEIYEFSSNSWRFVHDVTIKFRIQSKGVTLMGNVYWHSSEDHQPEKYEYMIVFDFTTEKFRHVKLPHSFPNGIMGLSSMNEDKLMIWHYCWDTKRLEIWMLTIDKTDQTKLLAWSKFLSTNLSYKFFAWSPLFVIEENKKFAMCYNINADREMIVYIVGEGDDNQLEINFKGDSKVGGWCQFAYSYFPSLVQF